MTFLDKYSPALLSALRIITGLLFLEHGTAKLLHFPHVEMFDTLNIVSLIGLAGIIELVGGTLVTVGFFSRWAAFICSGMSAAAYFIGHAGRSFYPVLNGGDAAILFCFVFLYIEM